MDPADAFAGATLLEPIAGTAFALNLAYIGLERFRYRQKIRSVADEHIKSLSSNGSPIPEQLKRLHVYQRLLLLSRLPNHSPEETKGANKTAKLSDDTWWGAVYDHVYAKHRDRKIVIFCAMLCVAILAIGVAHNIDTWIWIRPVFSKSYITYWFHAILLAGVSPVFLAYTGRKIVRKTVISAENCLEQFAVSLAASAGAASMPAFIDPRRVVPNRGPRPVTESTDSGRGDGREERLRQLERDAIRARMARRDD